MEKTIELIPKTSEQMRKTVKNARVITGAIIVEISLLDEGTNTFKPQGMSFAGIPKMESVVKMIEKIQPGFVFEKIIYSPLANPFAQKVVKEKKFNITKDFLELAGNIVPPRVIDFSQKILKIKEMALFPIIIQDKVIGLATFIYGKEIGEREIIVMESVVNQIALTLEHERLYYHSKKRIEEILKAIERIAAGELNVSLPISEKADEYDALSTGINIMVEEINEKTKQLNSKIEEIEEARKVLLSLSEDIQKEKETVEIKVKERTEELSEEHGKLFSLVESIKLGVIMVDLSLNIMLANPAAKRILGKPLSEVLTFEDLKEKIKNVKPSQALSQALSYYVQTGKPLNIQEAMIGDRCFRLFMSPVRDITEKIFIGAVMVMEDITEQKKLEKMRTEIVSVTSHQLRTPSSVIKGNLEMILGGDVGKITKEQKEILNETYLGNERMIKLINDLMDVAKIDEGRFELTLEAIQLKDLIAEIIKEILPLAKEKKVSLSYTPPSSPLPKVKIDRQRVKQVFQNLIDNAIKYSRIDSKGKVTVEVRKEEEKFLKVVVKDNGIGIPKDEQDKMFERFVRGSNVTKLDPGGGTGLGLYIAKAIIEQSGGKIWFVSEEGKGTTFFVTLPYK